MALSADLQDTIEACRTCGVYHLTTSNILRNIFNKDLADMPMIRTELSTWNIEVTENDGYPQYICTSCILDFQKIWKFRRSCTDMHIQWKHFYNIRMDITKIKTERTDPADEEGLCDFIYVDDLSDDDVDGENSKYKATTPFNILHVPIKQEDIESATVPADDTFSTAIKVERMDQGYPEKAHQANDIKKPEEDQEEFYEETSQGDETVTSADCNTQEEVQRSQNEQMLTTSTPVNDLKDRQCQWCGKKFKQVSLNRFRFHLRWHKMNRHHKCTKCTFYCNSRADLKDHMRMAHWKTKCMQCGEIVLTKRMKYHLTMCQILDEAVEEWPCQYCCTVSSSKSRMERHHMENHANELTTSTDNSLNESSIPYDADAVAMTDGDEAEESENQNTNDDDYEMGEEEEEEDDDDDEIQSILFVCAHCDQTFATASELQLHVRETHKNDLSNTSTRSANSSKTVETDPDEEPDEYLQHIKSEPIDEENKPGVVEVDIKEVHEEVEEDQNLEVSQKADNETVPAEELNQSKAQVTYTKRFQCSSCPCHFDNVEALKAHVPVHTKKAAFECQVCGQTFDLKFSLNRHLKKHK